MGLRMNKRVAIVAVAQTKYEEDKSPYWQGDLAFEPIEKVLKQTGLKYADQVGDDGWGIDKIWSAVEDPFVGRTCNPFWVHHYIGGFRMPQDNVSGDGTCAVHHAVVEILCGHSDTILVYSNIKESEVSRRIIENLYFDQIYLQQLGLDYLAAAGLQARRYMDKYGISREQCALAAVKARLNAKNNPYAQETTEITVEDVLNSEMLASPISVLDSKPAVSDGACAMILTTEEKAREITDKPVFVTGMGTCYDAHYLGDRDLADCDSLVSAATRAYEMAGITDPVSEIDVAEICAEHTYQELLWYEGLGFCGRGEGGKFIESGATQMTGKIPVNPSGGNLTGNPLMVAGLARVSEAVLQLRGEAGDRQIDNAKTALAQGFTGACGQSQCVLILSSK